MAAIAGGNSKNKVVGYAFLPLLAQGAFTGLKHELQVHAALKSGYLGAVDLEGLEGGKAILSVDTLLVSSVYTQLPQMRQMLRAVSDPFEAHAEPLKMVQSMSVVMQADPADVIKFLPLILTHLFRLICTRLFFFFFLVRVFFPPFFLHWRTNVQCWWARGDFARFSDFALAH